MNVTEPDCVYL